jgi:thiol-disulfide isomerase/thioredoxin
MKLLTPRGRIGLPLLLAGLLGLSYACSADQDLVLPDLDGRPRALSEFRGKWVLVNYWATWCPPCLEELAELELFHSAHQDQDALVLGVNFEDIDPAKLREFVETQFLSFPILRDHPRRRTELGDIPGLPTSFLVAPDGKVVARRVGAVTRAQVERSIAQFRQATPTPGSAP